MPVCAMHWGEGGLVATGGTDGSLQCWDPKGLFCTHNLREVEDGSGRVGSGAGRAHAAAVLQVRFHPRFRREAVVGAEGESTVKAELFSLSEDGRVGWWDLRTQKLIQYLSMHYGIPASLVVVCGRGAVFHSKTMAGADDTGEVKEDGEDDGGRGGRRWDPDAEEEVLITGGRDRVLCFFDLKRRRPMQSVSVGQSVESMVLLRERPGQDDGDDDDDDDRRHSDNPRRLLALAGDRGSVNVWGFTLHTPTAEVACLPLQELVEPGLEIGGSSDGQDQSAAKGAEEAENLESEHVPIIQNMVVSEDGRQLIAANSDHNFNILNVRMADEREAKTDNDEENDKDGISDDKQVLAYNSMVVGWNDDILDVRYIPDESTRHHAQHIVVATNSPQIRVFNVDSFQCTPMNGHKDIVLSIDVSPDGRWITSGSKDMTVRVWSALTGRPVAVGVGHAGAVGAVATSRRVAPFHAGAGAGTAGVGEVFMVSGSGDKTVKLWVLPMNELLDADEHRLLSGCKPARILGDAKRLAQHLLEEGVAHERNKHRHRHKSKESRSRRRSIDAHVVNGVARLRCHASVKAHVKDINAVAISPNDALVASASQDKTIALWTVSAASHSLKPAGILRGHRRGVWRVEFSPVDKILASCSGDRTVMLWNLTSRTCVSTLQGHTASVLSVRFINHGMQLLSSAADGLIKLWTIRTSECENTFDEHEDRCWALAVCPPSTTGTAPAPATGATSSSTAEATLSTEGDTAARFVSVGSDSVMNVWRDHTAETNLEEERAREQLILKEQELMNCIFSKNYSKAIAIALTLDRGTRLLLLLREVLEGTGRADDDNLDRRDSELKAREAQRVREHRALSWAHGAALEPYLRELSRDDLARLVRFMAEWNSNARHSAVAQAVLSCLLRCVSPQRLCAVPGMAATVDGLLAYTERHFERANRLHESSFLADFTLRAMNQYTQLDEDALAAVRRERMDPRLVAEMQRRASDPKYVERERAHAAMLAEQAQAKEEDPERILFAKAAQVVVPFGKTGDAGDGGEGQDSSDDEDGDGEARSGAAAVEAEDDEEAAAKKARRAKKKAKAQAKKQAKARARAQAEAKAELKNKALAAAASAAQERAAASKRSQPRGEDLDDDDFDLGTKIEMWASTGASTASLRAKDVQRRGAGALGERPSDMARKRYKRSRSDSDNDAEPSDLLPEQVQMHEQLAEQNQQREAYEIRLKEREQAREEAAENRMYGFGPRQRYGHGGAGHGDDLGGDLDSLDYDNRIGSDGKEHARAFGLSDSKGKGMGKGKKTTVARKRKKPVA